MKKIIIFGGGMIGSAIAFDLSKDYDVTVVDIDKVRLSKLSKKYPVKIIEEDISKKGNINKIIKDFDLAVSAVPGYMGYETLKQIIEAGKKVVDISFFDEDPFSLDDLAKQKNVTAVVDCGVAPGLSNIILGYHSTKMKIENFECQVGGLPFKRVLPYEYKAPFSPIDVIEEYTRPARIIENGKIVVKPALSDTEYINIDEAGTLEAFNTDGLRTLIKMDIPNMKEKTLRYPGHVERIKFLKESGFFNKDYIDLNGVKVKPVDLSAKLLFPLWHLNEDEKEFTVLQILIKGKEGKREKEYRYSLFDRFDEETKITSMARTTGFTCTSVSRLVVDDLYDKKGISAPEYIGADEKCYHSIIDDLGNRGVEIHCHSVVIR